MDKDKEVEIEEHEEDEDLTVYIIDEYGARETSKPLTYSDEIPF